MRSRVRELFPTMVIGTFLPKGGDGCYFRTGYTTNWDVRTRWPDETYDGGGFRAVDESFDAASVQVSDVGLPDVEAPREYLLEFAGRCDSSRHFADRWKLLHSGGWLTERQRVFLISNSAPELCELPACARGEHTQCATPWTEIEQVRASSEFSLMLRGEDVTSDRLQNAVAMLAIPLVLSDVPLSWLPLRHAIPWDELLVTVDRASFERNASEAVAAAVEAISPAERQARRHHLHHTRRDLLFGVRGSRAAERLLQAMALEPAAHCGSAGVSRS